MLEARLLPAESSVPAPKELAVGAIKEPTRSLYETDFAAWAFDQAAAVARGDWNAVDVPNLVEELESMGREQRAELRNRLAVLLAHLAKWQYQPEQRTLHGKSWTGTIIEQRARIEDHLDDNPSLKPYITEALQRAWRQARLVAANETALALPTFPVECPYAWEDIVNEAWLPDSTDGSHGRPE
jgi:hypothetical protein